MSSTFEHCVTFNILTFLNVFPCSAWLWKTCWIQNVFAYLWHVVTTRVIVSAWNLVLLLAKVWGFNVWCKNCFISAICVAVNDQVIQLVHWYWWPICTFKWLCFGVYWQCYFSVCFTGSTYCLIVKRTTFRGSAFRQQVFAHLHSLCCFIALASCVCDLSKAVTLCITHELCMHDMSLSAYKPHDRFSQLVWMSWVYTIPFWFIVWCLFSHRPHVGFWKVPIEVQISVVWTPKWVKMNCSYGVK